MGLIFFGCASLLGKRPAVVMALNAVGTPCGLCIFEEAGPQCEFVGLLRATCCFNKKTPVI